MMPMVSFDSLDPRMLVEDSSQLVLLCRAKSQMLRRNFGDRLVDMNAALQLQCVQSFKFQVEFVP